MAILAEVQGCAEERHAGGGLDHPEVMFLAADPFVPNRFWFGTWGNAAGMISFQKCPQ